MASTNRFGNLSIELLFEIFDYLSFNDIIKWFFGLNQELNSTIQAYPSKIVLCSCNDEKVFQFETFTCRSLEIDADDQPKLSMIIHYLNLTGLKAVTFNRNDPHCLNFPFDYVMNGRNRSTKWTMTDSDLKSAYQRLWLVIITSARHRLCYLKMKGEMFDWNPEQMPFDLPVLEYLILENISSNQMLDIMQHAPNLRCCKVTLQDRLLVRFTINICLPAIIFFHLMSHFDWSFEDFCRLFTITPHLKNLLVTLFVHKQALDDSSTWQTLVERYLPDLVRFHLHFVIYEDYLHGNFPECDLSSFHDDNYWMERKSRFTVQEHRI